MIQKQSIVTEAPSIINSSSQLLDPIVPIFILSDTPLSTIYAAIQSFKKLKPKSTRRDAVKLSRAVSSYPNVAMEVIKVYLRSYTVFQTSFI